MPTPTSTNFPRLLHTTSNNEEQDENVNQFGVNVSNVPMAMTPLTEKPQTGTHGELLMMAASTFSKRKPTISSQAPPTLPFLTQRASSTVSSNSESGNVSTNAAIEQRDIPQPAMDLSVFMDMDGNSERLQGELGKMLTGLNSLLGNLEERLSALNE